MLAVIEDFTAIIDAPRTSAERLGRFKNAGANSTLRERHCRRHARIPAADNGDLGATCVGWVGRVGWVRHATTQVRHAIHNFRSGVSEVRWVKTLKPSRSISSSSVR